MGMSAVEQELAGSRSTSTLLNYRLATVTGLELRQLTTASEAAEDALMAAGLTTAAGWVVPLTPSTFSLH
jgi:hypothetical protein